jgi:predicted N-formylglutamate amidohydrolase
MTKSNGLWTGRTKIAVTSLLSEEDPDPVSVINRDGASRVVLTCEHAGNGVPNELGGLGLDDGELSRHIAWDIGAAAIARRLADILDAPLVLQNYSRLVIDCNRPAHSDESIAVVSDGTSIPGNLDLSDVERDARMRDIHDPYHRTVGALLDDRMERRVESVVISIHTFTPALVVDPAPRPWDLCLLYNRDDRLARILDIILDDVEHAFGIAHNEPYSVCDETDYTIPVHGERRGINSLLLEVRDDHVRDDDGIGRWGNFLGNALKAAERHLLGPA